MPVKNHGTRASRRPANTAFRQQRLKAWQPILSPRVVIPTLFLLSLLVFAPGGTLILLSSNSVSQVTLDYTDCDRAKETPTRLRHFDYRLKSGDDKLHYDPPTWSYDSRSRTCTLQFNLPADISHPVFLYYKLTNFYQNHRRYVNSLDSLQLKGEKRSVADLKKTCSPLAAEGGKPIYPCGLIANSMFNDTIKDPVLLNVPGGTDLVNRTYAFSDKEISWPGEGNKYRNDPHFNWDDFAPPPNWRELWPSYNNSPNGHPRLQDNERFHNWMRTAALPNFSKLYGKSVDQSGLVAGTYQIKIVMNYPVKEFGGTKSVVLSNVSRIGGRNPFLAWSYIGTAAMLLSLALIATSLQCIRPRLVEDAYLIN
ncbi:Lem3/Cdc50 [Auricularia subglabra TFB-10046 SS5]|uniref:Lem3/Cdc50 n=1 Tax=Auricularia subglabra (strain TFB-10046 / SS5) TaxID=717982 RepID=J0WR23_AURST|nr:Lem3/Cdc50 [Auricularia subglabra TFB-10046 SS5]